MENFQYFLDSLNLYSNLLIATLTIVIIYFAYRSLRSSQEAIRLNTFPILFAKVITNPPKTTLVIENHSNYPAYDVEAFVLAQYFEEETPYKSLLSSKYKNEVKINFSRDLFSNEIDEGEYYSVYDCLRYYTFPPNKKVEPELNFMIPPSMVEIILQFRDSMGQNYLCQSWLYADSKKKHIFLTEGLYEFKFKPAKRIEILQSKISLKELFEITKVTKHINLPIRFLRIIPMYINILIARIKIYFYVEKNVRNSLLRIFPSGFQQNNKQIPVGGRGIFNKI